MRCGGFLEDSCFQIHILECWGPGLVYWEGGIPDQVEITIMLMLMMMVMMMMMINDDDDDGVDDENPQWKPLAPKQLEHC